MHLKTILCALIPVVKKLWGWAQKLWTPDPEKLYCIEPDKYSYTTDDIERLRDECVKIGASASPQFWDASNEDIRMCFNGVGPGCWSTKQLKLVNTILDSCEVMAMAHDFEFTHSARNYAHFTVANVRLIVNSILEGFSSGKKRLFIYGALLAVLSQLFGWPMYRDFDVAKFKEKVKEASK